MSDQDKSDHWNSLAAGIGATPPDEDEVESADAGEPEDVEPDPQAEVEEPVVEYLRPSTVLEETPPTDWGKLAGDLGIEVPEQPSEPASAPDDTSPPTVDLDEIPGPAEEPSDYSDLPAFADSRDRTEDEDRTEDVVDALVEDVVDVVVEDQIEDDEDDELTELVLDARDGSGFASGVFVDPVDVESDREEPEVIAEVAGVDALEAEGDTPQTDKPPAEKKSGRRRRRRRPRGRKSSDDQADTAAKPADDGRDDDSGAVVDAEADDTLETSLVADEAQSDSPDGEEPQPKAKRRRRRRRGSGRKSATASEGDQAAEKESAESDDEPKVQSDEKPKRRGRRKTAHDEDSEDGPENEESGKTTKSSHRAIPSWAEAIEVVVSANVENHKKSPRGGQSRSRGGRKRGGRDKSSGKAK